MAKDLDVTYQDMRDAAKHVVKEKDKLKEKLDGLRKYIANLVETGYVTKSSSKAFDENFDEFVRGAKDMLDGLDGMGDYLTTAADKFEQIDDELGKAARG
ncbi:WXG100 family type VII secretion target [Streptomyces spectabilis]|uniref:ESAT-6-like protein n=1 Tax=Streptomyces spectabilis TaxID=68270 RepID=A0A5P2X907_STRST|nr:MULTISPECIES: WXG100 family type VII secretion target [Streptomyces]MBB5108158.1 WXG100 family type VII secretion target [Streptomyces spectabilis]MCI3904380.1 WXG100 family type VII secretion target [Streptomyces spectabilis]MCI3932332.1 WXG100 family type VII secretion target [Streptomyces sp. AN091965]QEV61483.1 WXG100 family type VII secretion target [Streptomyces spectabilis]GGV26863.1 type VII secretion protein [Streptomyces spectabilis]